MENVTGDNGNITQTKIDARQVIGIDPEMEELYEDIT
jgi:hypothetical protein